MAVPLPEPRGYPGNLGLLVSEHAREARAAIIDLHDAERPRPVSFRELDSMCNAVARGFQKAGLAPGNRIAILSQNRVEFVAVLLGAMRAGVVPVPINIKLAAGAVQYIVNDSGAKLLFAEGELRRLCPAGIDIVEYGGASFERFLDPGEFEAFDPGPDSVAIQPYTSGSTGRPKGVLLTHYGQNWSRRILAHTRGTTPDDVILVAAPLYHKNALNAIKQGLTAGATLPLLPQFNVERYVHAIGRYRATVISGVPTMMSMVLARKDLLAHTDTSSVRTIMMGSAPSSPELLAQLATTFPNAQPLVVYGVTEGGPVPLGPHPEGKARPSGSIGYPYPGTGAKLDGAANEDGEAQGELMLRNPGVLLAYHNLPDETAARIQDGWYRTGDICRRDRDGFYFFVGRVDDMFVCGGENIFPIEVETLLEKHPAVHQAYVMPFQHELKGEVPYAFVVLRAGAHADEDELKRFALVNGPAYQHPRRVFFLDQLPLAGTNKIDRERLRSLVATDAETQESHRSST